MVDINKYKFPENDFYLIATFEWINYYPKIDKQTQMLNYVNAIAAPSMISTSKHYFDPLSIRQRKSNQECFCLGFLSNYQIKK